MYWYGLEPTISVLSLALIGCGIWGLDGAAHLLGRGIRHEIFGFAPR
jgi:hypothetical protein